MRSLGQRVVGAALVAFTLLAAGCNGDNSAKNGPSGALSPAAVPGSAGGGGGGGAGGFRIVAWNDDNIYPGGGLFQGGPATWIWVSLAQIDPNSLDVTVNGASQTISGLTLPLANPNAPEAIAVILQPPAAAGDKIQATANDAQGNPVSSNTVTVAVPPTPNPPMAVITPPDQTTGVPTDAEFTWKPHPAALSYQLIVWELDSQGSLVEMPVIVEVNPVAGANADQKFKAGASGAKQEWANNTLTPAALHVWNAVALDSTGYGVGSTIDVVQWNAAGTGTIPPTVAATWPVFQTQ